jgi:Kdo2-lipid IVA lauroyltransferase/acyltransferase
MPAHPLRRLQTGAFAVLVRLIRALPGPRALRDAGRILGALTRLANRDWHRRIRTNLDLVYRESLPAARRRAIERAVFEHSGRGFCELFWDCREHGLRIEDWCTVEGREHLDAALAPGQGALLATAHLGSWTMVPRYLTYTGYPTASLLRFPDNHAADVAMRSLLRRVGLTGYGTPLARADVHACLRLLRDGGCLFIAADRRAHDVKIPFLGHDAWCATGTAALHLRTGAAVVPCYTVRTGTGHRIVFEPALQIAYSGERGADTQRITQALHDRFGTWIGAHPEQWMWNHRRWRARRRERRALPT